MARTATAGTVTAGTATDQAHTAMDPGYSRGLHSRVFISPAAGPAFAFHLSRRSLQEMAAASVAAWRRPLHPTTSTHRLPEVVGFSQASFRKMTMRGRLPKHNNGSARWPTGAEYWPHGHRRCHKDCLVFARPP